MGLDIFIYETTNVTTDDKGRSVETRVQLDNLHNCHNFLNVLDRKRDGGFTNNATLVFYEGEIFSALADLKEDLKTYENGTAYRFPSDTDEHFNARMQQEQSEYKSEIAVIEKFIKENNLQEQAPTEEDEEYGVDDQYGREFEINAWW